ncbi:MOSC domain-containing protein [Cohnella thailandensis]|nr:MOSC domain-containing protein YiiM [Cohnella thailandensis]
MAMGIIESVNAGLPMETEYGGRTVLTGIRKRPASGPLRLTKLGFEGDGQADLAHHGGADKAVCVYPYEHYPYWQAKLGMPMAFGAFGENATMSGWTEEQVRIGDILRLGGAVVQVSQPRQPCFKLSVRYGIAELPLWVQQSGFTGYYFRVIEEGVVAAGDPALLLEPHPLGITVGEANRIMHEDKKDEAGIRRLLSVEALSDSWRATMGKRLAGKDAADARDRLEGGR